MGSYQTLIKHCFECDNVPGPDKGVVVHNTTTYPLLDGANNDDDERMFHAQHPDRIFLHESLEKNFVLNFVDTKLIFSTNSAPSFNKLPMANASPNAQSA